MAEVCSVGAVGRSRLWRPVQTACARPARSAVHCRGSVHGLPARVAEPQALVAAPYRVLAIEMAPHHDLKAGAGAPPGLCGELAPGTSGRLGVGRGSCHRSERKPPDRLAGRSW